MGNCKNLEHAEHNLEVCKHLYDNTEFNDWVITTAFYSALHFVRHTILPYKYINNGKTKIFSDFETMYSAIGRPQNKSKHIFLLDLVENELQEIHVEYNTLLDLANSSQYINYNFEDSQAKLAVNYLKRIKEFCQEDKS